ncbi:unnamed protein product [Cuscuta epithymum]|uniref:Aldose 1-epimerase n=1 Tax=Cuscuta epithymum TaxID=186058 RepID=A0AAV0ELI2_9ASTE|nr:unnamed protein product [Cuscuta epithymum]
MLKVSVSMLLFLYFICFAIPESVNGYDDLQFYEIKSGNFSVNVTNFAASLVSVKLPNKHGILTDVILGYDTVDEYKNNDKNLGAVIGRVANRIRDAHFSLNGTQYNLDRNSGNNSINGGSKGFSRVAWELAEHKPDSKTPYITFTLYSPDGDQGFPGDVTANVTYTINDNYTLSIDMKAITANKPTPISITTHAYWNLGGHNSGNIFSEKLQLFASNIAAMDNDLLTTGNITSILKTTNDFLEPSPIGIRINQLPKPVNSKKQKGFDTYYVLDAYNDLEKDRMNKVAVLCEETSGIRMDLSSNAPGLQLYTANNLKNLTGKGGVEYKPYAGVCLETQSFPDAVNHQNFPSSIITKETPYSQTISLSFSTNLQC